MLVTSIYNQYILHIPQRILINSLQLTLFQIKWLVTVQKYTIHIAIKHMAEYIVIIVTCSNIQLYNCGIA